MARDTVAVDSLARLAISRISITWRTLAQSGGLSKALLFVNTARDPYTIQSYYNSPLHGAAATTPPCGFNLIELGPDNFTIDMGFEIDDRFIWATRFGSFAALGMLIEPDNHALNIVWYDTYRQQFTGISYGIAVF